MRNLLVIVSDEHRFDAMGCAGHDFVRTPNLDALADRSVRFTNAYTPSPICVPARAAFATGRYVHQTGHWDNASPYTGAPRGWATSCRMPASRLSPSASCITASLKMPTASTSFTSR